MSDNCVRCDAPDGGYHFSGRVCTDCLTPYERRRIEDDLVTAVFYDKTRSIISGLLDIIRQEVYPAMNRVPECDQWLIDSALMEVSHLRDDIESGLVSESHKPKNSHRAADEIYRERRRLDAANMVERMNEFWAKEIEYPTNDLNHRIGWGKDKIVIPYPEGCHPVARLAAESAPFVITDGWKREGDE